MTWRSLRREGGDVFSVRKKLVEIDPEDSSLYEASSLECDICEHVEWWRRPLDANGVRQSSSAQEAKDHFMSVGWTLDGWDDICPNCSGGRS